MPELGGTLKITSLGDRFCTSAEQGIMRLNPISRLIPSPAALPSAAGLILSFDASRLARNNGDWHQLLQLCSMFGVLIADSEPLYDPGLYHDRLLLGLSGIMSEAELHQILMRQHQAERQKAAR